MGVNPPSQSLKGKLKSAFLLKNWVPAPLCVQQSCHIEHSAVLHRGINRGILIDTAFLLIRNSAAPGLELKAQQMSLKARPKHLVLCFLGKA